MNVEMQTPNTKWCYDECKDKVYWSNINLVVANRYNHYNNYLIHNTNGEIKSNINLVVTIESQKRQSCNFLIPSLSSHINLADAAVMLLPNTNSIDQNQYKWRNQVRRPISFSQKKNNRCGSHANSKYQMVLPQLQLVPNT
jgi:hypothetical protein